MTTMTPMRHALLARTLIKACGGLDEAAAACRLGKSQLANFQDAERAQDESRAQFMPTDVLADLEAYCGKPLYSRALADARPGAAESACLLEEACLTVETATKLMGDVRNALADGVIDAGERQAIQRTIMLLASRLADLTSLTTQWGQS